MMHVIIAEGLYDADVRRAPHRRLRRARRPRARALARVGRRHHRHPGRAHRRAGAPLRGDEAGDDRARRQLDAQGRQRLAGRARDRLPARAHRQPRHPGRRLRAAPRQRRARPGADHDIARARPAPARAPTSPTRCRASPRRCATARCARCCCCGTNMLSSFADAERAWPTGLARADLVVSYDLFLNDTARRFADVVLPATAWLEEIGLQDDQHAPLPDADRCSSPPARRARRRGCCASWRARLGADGLLSVGERRRP